MGWTVKRIQEDDYGCEERLEDAKVKVLVAQTFAEVEVRGGKSQGALFT